MSTLAHSYARALACTDCGVGHGTHARFVAKQAAVLEAFTKIGSTIATADIACGIQIAIGEHTDPRGVAAGAGACDVGEVGDVVARDRCDTEKRQKSTQRYG